MANEVEKRGRAVWLVTLLLVLTVVVRGGALWALRANLDKDPDAYRHIAENLLQHGQFAVGKGDEIRPTAYRPPLYPVVLSNLPAADGRQISLAKVAALHLLLGVATVWLTCRHWLTGFAPWLAGFLVACDPILLNQQSLVMTETLAAFLAILSLWCLARFDNQRSWFNAALAGGAIGLAVLCRPTFLPWLALVGAAMLFIRGGRILQSTETAAKRPTDWFKQFGWRLANLAALTLAAATIIAPWAIRNQQVFGKPIVTTTHGGYTLWLGNNRGFYDYLATDTSGLPWDSGPETLLWDVFQLPSPIESELFQDRGFSQGAWAAIDTRRLSFMQACFYRLRQLWSPLPYKLTSNESTGRRLLRYATCAWYCGVYALAAVGIWRLRWKLLQPPWIWGVLLCVAFTAVHTFYWTNLRMRAPLMPFVAILAAAGCVNSKLDPKTEH